MELLNHEDYFSTEHLKPDLKRRAVSGAAIVVISRFINHAIRMASIIVLARLLTPNDFGLVAMVTSISAFLEIFCRLGLTDATIQRSAINHNQISTLFWINLAFSFFLMALFIIASPLIAWFYGEPKIKLIAIITSLGFIFSGLSTQHLALLKRKMQFFKYTVNEVVGTIISVGVAIVMALKGFGYWAIVARPIISTMSTVAGGWLLCQWRPGLPAFGTGVRPMLKFGMNILGSYTVNYFSQNLDKILIGRFFGAKSLGYYNKAFQLFVAPITQLTIPLTSVAVATLSRLNDEPKKYLNYYLKSLSLLAFVGMPMSIYLALNSQDIILFLLGDQWIKTAKIFSVFSIGIGIQLILATNGWLHISLGKTEKWLRWNIVGSIVTIIAFLIGLKFGPLGVAAAYTCSLHALIVPGLRYAGKPIDLKFSSILQAIWRYYFSAIIAGLTCWFIIYGLDCTSNIFSELNIILRLLNSFFLYTIIYLIATVILYQNMSPISQFISVLREILPPTLFRTRT